MRIQPNSERVPIMLDIFARSMPELRHLDSAGWADELRRYAREHTTEGIFNSRSDVEPFINRLICWLTQDLGITDQELFEDLSELTGAASDEYRPWSPEYTHPITNAEALKPRD